MESRALDNIPQTPQGVFGYQWNYYSSLQDGPVRSRADEFLSSVNWSALLDYAVKKRYGIECMLLDDIGLGHNHMVRIIEFDDETRWVARLRMPPLEKSRACEDEDALKTMAHNEFNAISLVRQKTSIPVPEIHAFEAQSDCDVGAPFMLMDCLDCDVGMDLDMMIPPEYKQVFLSSLAKIHVQLSTVQLPKIGTIVSMNKDGTYQQGPIPGLGGPFDTATAFFEAWAAKVQFAKTVEQPQTASGEYAAEIAPSVSSFTKSISELAGRLSVCDNGPFPLCHGDFGHNNIIVDERYNVHGVIDWETAFAGPWEVFSDFPLTLSTVPPAMDLSSNYDENGSPKSDDLAQRVADQKEYVAAVKQEENRSGGDSHYLSKSLEDSGRQQLATAMRLYQNGVAGWYSKVIDQFSHR